MKSKFKNLNFEGVEVLSKEEKAKVKGGYLGDHWHRCCAPYGICIC